MRLCLYYEDPARRHTISLIFKAMNFFSEPLTEENVSTGSKEEPRGGAVVEEEEIDDSDDDETGDGEEKDQTAPAITSPRRSIFKTSRRLSGMPNMLINSSSGNLILEFGVWFARS